MKIGADHELARYIEETIIANDCSPAAVLGYAKVEGPDIQDLCFRSNHLQLYQKRDIPRITQVDLPRRGKKKQGYKKVKTRKDQARASPVRASNADRRE